MLPLFCLILVPILILHMDSTSEVAKSDSTVPVQGSTS